MNFAILDIQGLQNQYNEFVLKELALLSLDEKIIETYHFEPPKGVKEADSSKSWFKKYNHGLKWTDGYIPYTHLKSIFKSIDEKFDKFFVKGMEEKLWIWQFLSKDVENVEVRGCHDLKDLKSGKSCLKNHPICALKNADKIRLFLNLHCDPTVSVVCCRKPEKSIFPQHYITFY